MTISVFKLLILLQAFTLKKKKKIQLYFYSSFHFFFRKIVSISHNLSICQSRICLHPSPLQVLFSCLWEWAPCSTNLQSFPASGSFPMSQFFVSSGQSVGVSASASILPMNVQDWFPLGWLIEFPCCPRDSQESSPTPQFKSINSSVLSFNS